MIGAEQFKRMKKTARIVNAARGGIVNEQDLAEALKNGEVAGAALDVYSSEPFKDNPFIGLENVTMTPHLAASTGEAQLTVAIEVAKQMVEYLESGAIVNAVNVPSLDSETRKTLQPLLFLADRLGAFQAAFTRGTPQEVQIEYCGDVGVTDVYPITASILTGFLRPMVEEVNMVSAPSQLDERGISCSEKRSAAGSNYKFEIRVTVVTDKEKHKISGTLFHGGDPRICSIDERRVDARPEGHMLVCINDDVPLIIGSVCMRIGEAGINIGNLMLGRDARGGHAMTVLNLDQPIDGETLKQVLAVPHVNEARPITLPE